MSLLILAFVSSHFLIKLQDGNIKPATPITRLKINGTDTEYFYYAIDDDNDANKASILASRLTVEDDLLEDDLLLEV